MPFPDTLDRFEKPYYPLEKIIDNEVYETLNDEVKAEMQLSKNKLLWAKETLGWSTFHKGRGFDQFYQRQILLCTAKLRVIRCGRRMGKCIAEGSKIITANRGPICIEDINSDDVLITYDENLGKLFKTKEFLIEDNGIKECLIVRTKNGKNDIVTKNHPYYVLDKGVLVWKNAEDLQIGDLVAIPRNYDGTFDENIEDDDKSLYEMFAATLDDEIPISLYSSSNQNIKFFISAIFKNGNFTYTNKHLNVIEGLKHLLIRIGMHCKYSYDKENDLYTLTIIKVNDGNFKKADYCFEEIEKIKVAGEKQTYSVSVAKTHTFVTNDIITHNSESALLDALHFALTNNNKKVLFVGPFQNLIDEIFDRFDALLSSDDSIYVGTYKRKRKPHKITFNNGSTITGFTTGISGDSIRGQSADFVIFDEAAYIPPLAYRTTLAFLLDNKNVRMLAMSTPVAIEGKFKNWCLKDSSWKDFHFPATILPDYKQQEKSFKSNYTNEDFKLEVLAEFTDGNRNVFKSSDISSAIKKYDYITSINELQNPSNWIISIGVDYNEYKNGVQIVVLGFNKYALTEKPFVVLNRISIHSMNDEGSKLKNTQTLAVETIIEMYQKFNADYVYVDEGHGSMQNEILAKYFYEHSKMNVFKSIDFSKAYEYEDLYTQERKTKRLKVMMVYFLQKRFEMKEIQLNETGEPEGQNLLIDQVKGYSIKRFDSREDPVFEGEDHILDALLLANFAIVENNNTIFDKRTGNIVATIDKTFVKEFKSSNSNSLFELNNKSEKSSVQETKPYITNSNLNKKVTIFQNKKRRCNNFEIF